MENKPSHNKAQMMKSRAIRLNVVNPKSISVYSEVRATRGNILNKFSPYLIKSDLWFHILKILYQVNL